MVTSQKKLEVVPGLIDDIDDELIATSGRRVPLFSCQERGKLQPLRLLALRAGGGIKVITIQLTLDGGSTAALPRLTVRCGLPQLKLIRAAL